MQYLYAFCTILYAVVADLTYSSLYHSPASDPEGPFLHRCHPIRHTFDVNLLDTDINHGNGKLPAGAIAPFPPTYSYWSREKLEFHIPLAVA
jgi:hypothetical protein